LLCPEVRLLLQGPPTVECFARRYRRMRTNDPILLLILEMHSGTNASLFPEVEEVCYSSDAQSRFFSPRNFKT
jgi:hypothetical protein